MKGLEDGTPNNTETQAQMLDAVENAGPAPEGLGSQEKTQEDPFAKGRERMAAMGKFFTDAKEKTSSWRTALGNKMSFFWKKTKSVGAESVAAILSADELAKKADKAISEKTNEFGQYIGRKGAEAYDTSKEFIVDAYTEQKAIAEDFYKEGKAFAKDVGNATAEVVTAGVELGKDVAFAVKEKTVEGFNTAKEGISKQYNNVVEFGEKSIMAAKARTAEVKQGFRDFFNQLHVNRLQAAIEKSIAAQNKLEQQKSMEKEKEMIAREKLAQLQSKMNLQHTLQYPLFI